MGAGGRDTRRQWLERLVGIVLAGLGAPLAAILAAFAWPPVRPGGTAAWRRAARLDDLTPGVPYRAVVSHPREQGWYRERARAVVYVLWDGRNRVRALSAVCTHLGCRVRWDPEVRRYLCPCHGGAYDAEGTVAAGPPPRPLAALEARLDESRGEIWVRL